MLLQATSPPKRRKLTPGSLASGMDCLCASQKSAPGERNVHAAHPGKDEERQLADFSPRAAVSITTPWLEPSTLMTPRHLSVADRLLKLRYPATCVNCGADLPAGARGWWDSESRSATCTACRPPQAPDPSTRPPVAALPDAVQGPPTSAAGASAQLMYERKRRRREAEIDQKWGRLSGAVKFLSDDPQSTKAWAKGSEGERKLAAHLVRTVGDRAVMLHDRRIPGSRANIDHLVVAASGIWIIDAKSYKGKVEQRDVGKWLKMDNRLYVNGRDQSKLVGGLARQINAVLEAIEDAALRVNAALCFVDSEWGLFSKPFHQGGVLVTWPKKLSEAIAEPGPLSPTMVMNVADRLAAALPPSVRVG
jgi:hypothetical protein